MVEVLDAKYKLLLFSLRFQCKHSLTLLIHFKDIYSIEENEISSVYPELFSCILYLTIFGSNFLSTIAFIMLQYSHSAEHNLVHKPVDDVSYYNCITRNGLCV